MNRAELLPSKVIQDLQDLIFGSLGFGKPLSLGDSATVHDALGDLVDGVQALEALWLVECEMRKQLEAGAEIVADEPAQAAPRPAGALPPEGEALLVALQRSVALAAIEEVDGNVLRVAFRPALQGIWHNEGDAA